jgi:PAS domain S-box-containing protein
MLLSIVNEVSAVALHATEIDELMVKVCDVFIKYRDYSLVWSGTLNEDSRFVEPAAMRFKTGFSGGREDVECLAHVADAEANPSLKAVETMEPAIMNDIPSMFQYPQLREAAINNGFTACAAWPLSWQERLYGVINIYTSWKDGFVDYEEKLLQNIIADISLGLYSIETRERLHRERDLNREIIDTVNALMVSVSHCGEIVSFNSQAERVSGYSRGDVMGKYWVDVLIQPEDRKAIQALFSKLLQQDMRDINFQATLAARNGSLRIVNWHSSILSDLDRRGLGLVFIGTDITDHIKTDQALERAIADWDHIFSSIPEPALTGADFSLTILF